jgi:Family of unknown function (DUF6345)
MFQFKNQIIFFTMVFCTFMVIATNGGVHYVGAYAYNQNGQDIFIRDCNKFRAQFPATVGVHSYRNDQYAWAYRSIFVEANNANVDYEDLAFVSGHGNAYSFATIGGSTNFNNTGDGWGSRSGGFLKWIGFFTCQTIKTPAQDAAAWSAYQNTTKGVHVMCGFHTNSALADTNLPNKWAEYMKGGDYVWNSWIRAVNDSAWWNWFTYNTIGKVGIVMWFDQAGNPAKDAYYDRLSSYSQAPSAGAGMRYIYQY